MNDAIKRYEKAEIELKEAEKDMSKSLEPYIKAAYNDEERLMRIIGLMPRTFHGTRRMYERILRMREEITTENSREDS